MGRRRRVGPASFAAAAIAVAAALAACAARDDAAGAAPSPGLDACGLEADVASHACDHATRGPFVDLPSGAEGTEGHVVYRVAAGADGRFEVGLRPSRSGTWALLVAPADAAFAASVRGGAVRVARLADPSCTALGATHLVALDADVTVWLRGAAPEPVVRVLAERVDAARGHLEGATCASLLASLAERAPPSGLLPADAAADSLDATDADGGGGTSPPPREAGACRSDGPCTRDDECCDYCHDMDHCH